MNREMDNLQIPHIEKSSTCHENVDSQEEGEEFSASSLGRLRVSCPLLTLDLDLRRMTVSMIILRTSCPAFCVSRGLLGVDTALVLETVVALHVHVGLGVRTALGIYFPVHGLGLGINAVTIGLILLHVLVPRIPSPGLPLRLRSTLAPSLRQFRLRLDVPPPRHIRV